MFSASGPISRELIKPYHLSAECNVRSSKVVMSTQQRLSGSSNTPGCLYFYSVLKTIEYTFVHILITSTLLYKWK